MGGVSAGLIAAALIGGGRKEAEFNNAFSATLKKKKTYAFEIQGIKGEVHARSLDEFRREMKAMYEAEVLAPLKWSDPLKVVQIY